MQLYPHSVRRFDWHSNRQDIKWIHSCLTNYNQAFLLINKDSKTVKTHRDNFSSTISKIKTADLGFLKSGCPANSFTNNYIFLRTRTISFKRVGEFLSTGMSKFAVIKLKTTSRSDINFSDSVNLIVHSQATEK